MLCGHGGSVRLGVAVIYLYARVSTDKQEHGREAQIDRLHQWAAGKEVGGIFVDEDVSAHSVRFQDRPAGGKLWNLLQPEDIVVATKMDRMFRRLADMASTIDTWKRLNIRLVLLDMDVDIKSPHGRAFAGWAAVSAQLESELHGQRKREVYAHRRKMGLPVNSQRPFGWLSYKGPDGKLAGYKPCPKEQELGLRVLEMRKQGMKAREIAIAFAHAGHRKPYHRRGSSGYYHVTDIYLLERAAKAGYPTRSRDFWQAAGSARTQHAEISGGSQQSS